jgi:hypothetical protein
MFYFAVGILCAYGIFRVCLDFQQEKEIGDINEHLRSIDESLYSIKARMKSDGEKK